MTETKKEPLFDYGFKVQKQGVEAAKPETVCELWTSILTGAQFRGQKTGSKKWLPMKELGTFQSPEAAWAQARLLGANGNDQTYYRIVAV